MKITANGIEIPIEFHLNRSEYVNGAKKEMVELWRDTPFTEDEIAALEADQNWKIVEGEGNQTMSGYTQVVRHTLWLAQVDANAAIVQEKVQEIAALEQEKAAVIEEKAEMQTAAKTFLRSQTGDTIVALSALIGEWNPNGSYEQGDPTKRTIEGVTSLYTCAQKHDGLNDPNRAPEKAPALWAIYHAKSAQYALPFVAPTGAHDIYRANEYMLFTDGAIYKCLEDTDWDPAILPAKWQKVDAQGNPINE